MPNDMDFHQKAYVCTHVFAHERPVLLVSRADGAWALVCGDTHPEDASSYAVVGIGHVIDRDPTLEAVLDLPPAWDAERRFVGGEWVRCPSEP